MTWVRIPPGAFHSSPVGVSDTAKNGLLSLNVLSPLFLSTHFPHDPVHPWNRAMTLSLTSPLGGKYVLLRVPAVQRHDGRALLQRSLAWRSLRPPHRPSAGQRHVRASELATYGFCPEAHRLDRGLEVPSSPGTSVPDGLVPTWDTPEARHGRMAHLEATRRVQRPTGAWTTRAVLLLCGLAILASLILRFG